MLRDSFCCPHCGKAFVRLTEQMPLVNRSDGLHFHLSLFAGPDPRTKFGGGFYDDQVICNFAYAHDHFGPKIHTFLLVITHAEADPEKVLNQVEGAVDKLAELIEAGKRLTTVYTFDGQELTEGLLV